MRLPIPSVGVQPSQSPQFSAPGVAPQRDATGQQLQQLGQGLHRTGAAVGGIADELQAEWNSSRIKEADNLAADVYREEMGRYLNAVGQDAGQAQKDATFAAIEQRSRSIGEKLQNPFQREEFQARLADRRQQAMARADQHYRDQVRIDAIGQSKARFASEQVDALNSVGNPTEWRYHKGVMAQEVDNQADLDGIGKDNPRRKLAHLQATTDLHDAAIRAEVGKGNITAASSMLQAAGDEIAPQVRTKLEGLVQQANVDKQSFEAARYLSQRVPTLGKQIEALNQLVEDPNTKLSIEVRDAAERRLRGMEQIDYQEKARLGNETSTQAEAFAARNRVSTWDELPLEMRQGLEASGRAEPFKVWLEQGQQFITTQRGIDIMRRAEDESWLRGQTIEALMASARDDLNRRDGDALIAAWYKAHQLPPPKGVGDGMVSMVLNRRMRELGYLPSDKEPTPEQTNRRNWVLESVQRSLGTGAATQDQVDNAIETALASTMSREKPTGMTGWWGEEETLPIAAMSPKEQANGYFNTRFGHVPWTMVSDNLIKQKTKEIDAINAARAAVNAKDPTGPQIALLPDTVQFAVQTLREEQNNRKVARDAAYKDAMEWMRSNRQELGKDAWHYLPDDLRTRAEATGIAPKARLDYEDYDKTHDFLGRPKADANWQSNPNSPMHNFSSPYGNR